ncbi:MAG: hemerythrin domain-containing protein, partial [Thermoanaerobaculia bacterium]
MPNALDVLKEDHQKVKKLLDELVETKSSATRNREELLDRIDRELRIHTTIEEEIFYPAFRDAVEKKEDEVLFFESKEEHHVVDMVLPELKKTNPNSNEFLGKAHVLNELVHHHIHEEEDEM